MNLRPIPAGMQRTPSQQQQGYQQRVKRLVASQAWAANTLVSIPLPRNYDVETIYVTFTGTENYPAALVGAVVRHDAPFGLVQSVQVIAEGRQTIFNIPGYVIGMFVNRRHKRPTYQERFETFNN